MDLGEYDCTSDKSLINLYLDHLFSLSINAASTARSIDKTIADSSMDDPAGFNSYELIEVLSTEGEPYVFPVNMIYSQSN